MVPPMQKPIVPTALFVSGRVRSQSMAADMSSTSLEKSRRFARAIAASRVGSGSGPSRKKNSGVAATNPACARRRAVCS